MAKYYKQIDEQSEAYWIVNDDKFIVVVFYADGYKDLTIESTEGCEFDDLQECEASEFLEKYSLFHDESNSIVNKP